MQFKQQQVADEFRWLHMRDLAPEEFLSWLLEWGPVQCGPGWRMPALKLSVCLNLEQQGACDGVCNRQTPQVPAHVIAPGA